MLNHENLSLVVVPSHWDNMMKGITPCLSYEPVRQNPRPDLIKTIRDYVNSGLKPQQEIAKEIGLSRTKMSQFMNNAKRVKGWTEVEARLDKWIKEFKKSKRTAHIRFLEKVYESKAGKPERPVVDNVYKRAKTLPQHSGISLDPPTEKEVLTFTNACTATDSRNSSYSFSEIEEDGDVDTCISVSSKDSEHCLEQNSIELDDGCWSSFEIGKALHM